MLAMNYRMDFVCLENALIESYLGFNVNCFEMLFPHCIKRFLVLK